MNNYLRNLLFADTNQPAFVAPGAETPAATSNMVDPHASTPDHKNDALKMILSFASKLHSPTLGTRENPSGGGGATGGGTGLSSEESWRAMFGPKPAEQPFSPQAYANTRGWMDAAGMPRPTVGQTVPDNKVDWTKLFASSY